MLAEGDRPVTGGGELVRAGFSLDAQKEYAEGSITFAFVNGKPPPAPEELAVDPAAYLLGMGEAVGELRRYLLDSMREGDLSRGEELLSAMDDIYNILVTVDFPDAITHGLRRTTDMVRGVLEKTRSDLTVTLVQKGLEDRLKRYETAGKPEQAYAAPCRNGLPSRSMPIVESGPCPGQTTVLSGSTISFSLMLSISWS